MGIGLFSAQMGSYNRLTPFRSRTIGQVEPAADSRPKSDREPLWNFRFVPTGNDAILT
jgi:hypothetical protein